MRGLPAEHPGTHLHPEGGGRDEGPNPGPPGRAGSAPGTRRTPEFRGAPRSRGSPGVHDRRIQPRTGPRIPAGRRRPSGRRDPRRTIPAGRPQRGHRAGLRRGREVGRRGAGHPAPARRPDPGLAPASGGELHRQPPHLEPAIRGTGEGTGRRRPVGRRGTPATRREPSGTARSRPAAPRRGPERPLLLPAGAPRPLRGARRSPGSGSRGSGAGPARARPRDPRTLLPLRPEDPGEGAAEGTEGGLGSGRAGPPRPPRPMARLEERPGLPADVEPVPRCRGGIPAPQGGARGHGLRRSHHRGDEDVPQPRRVLPESVPVGSPLPPSPPRRIPGHERRPVGVAAGPDAAVDPRRGTRRRRSSPRHERPPRAPDAVHRGRPEAVHLPLPERPRGDPGEGGGMDRGETGPGHAAPAPATDAAVELPFGPAPPPLLQPGLRSDRGGVRIGGRDRLGLSLRGLRLPAGRTGTEGPRFRSRAAGGGVRRAVREERGASRARSRRPPDRRAHPRGRRGGGRPGGSGDPRPRRIEPRDLPGGGGAGGHPDLPGQGLGLLLDLRSARPHRALPFPGPPAFRPAGRGTAALPVLRASGGVARAPETGECAPQAGRATGDAVRRPPAFRRALPARRPRRSHGGFPSGRRGRCREVPRPGAETAALDGHRRDPATDPLCRARPPRGEVPARRRTAGGEPQKGHPASPGGRAERLPHDGTRGPGARGRR